MKNLSIVSLILLLAVNVCAQPSLGLKLWYDRPADLWVEALPLGNGRLGAMVYGNPAHEEFQLNEETIWGGSPYNNTNPLAKDALPEIRQLIFEGQNLKAQEMCGPAICSQGANGMPYQTVGSLHFDFEGMDSYHDYYRELDIEKAIAKTTFSANGVKYTREAFTSFTDQLLMIRFTASEKGKITFTTRYTSPYKDARKSVNEKMLQMDGKASDHEGIEGKVRFTSLVKVDNDGGRLEVLSDSTIKVIDANSVILYVSIGTNFKNYQDVTGDSEKTAIEYLKRVGTKTFEKYLADHSAYYTKFFDRVSLDLGSNEQATKTTDVRVKEFATTFDPQMSALYFQFGRYLLICSSQPGGQPANLQGIWNYQLRAPWDGKYTTDINVEMNYWPAEVTNLAEMHQPFLQLIEDVALTGKESAAMYGARGWTLHHNTDIWRSTGAVDGPKYGVWPTCNAWFSQHLWDRYLFSGDDRYLSRAYPIMKEACKFYLDFLVKEPENGWLVVAPSYSPENAPNVKGKREWVVTAGCTMDNQMVFDLFSNTIQAATVLSEDKLFIDSLQSVVNQLPPMQIGKWGQLQEWMQDWDNPRDRHRHISHLWGLYPGYQINKFESPALFEAAKTSLIHRGDPSTGWSMGWKVCLWARLLDGNHAYKLIQDQLKPTVDEKGQNGGTYPNLFDAHPPFQIDGNFGCTAGIAEMLVQSHTGSIHLLPAIPEVWAKGTVKGLRCRGGFDLQELTWENGKVKKVKIKSNVGGTLRIRCADKLQMKGQPLNIANAELANRLLETQKIKEPLITANAPVVTPSLSDTFLYDIDTKKGEVYELEYYQ
ncbi:glycoside hydrolase family 95 protein [Dysgonomonas macrotermitis]|uniref:Alpha-L-fucosidase 2 n=1 Tax=Dysgonomonas macrotermitis TaxID=1346286 RepID=A0A1M4X4K7_9BACT|nr:glycoside hydrolase family 95 protein [Dysgonomonas macrotermitis]SHE88401.1 alpha-L-fucosidase 2 [Dysgonomonas macrotermitis]